MSVIRLATLSALALGSVLAKSADAGAVDKFTCAFGAECIGIGNPCKEDEIKQVTLTRTGEVWMLQGENDTEIAFVQVGAGDGHLLNLLSTRADPAASAVMLLSVAPNGRAFLSTHGVFRELQVVVNSGICRPEAP